MSNLSVRGVDRETLASLKARASKEGISVNALILRLIDQGLGKVQRKSIGHRYDDLDVLAGVWGDDETAEFEAATAPFSEVEPELWR